ncbi:Hypothetical protein bglu_1g06770 [Burkholderia glumae BGR1]|nr:Hypothetical protein bglu_1g06770 [Burkholderia glumae BGR1]
MGSVKHTVSVKCVQVDRGGRVHCVAGGMASPTWRKYPVDARRDSHRRCTQRRTTAAQANGKNGTLRFTVGGSTLNPEGSIASHAGGDERRSLLDA